MSSELWSNKGGPGGKPAPETLLNAIIDGLQIASTFASKDNFPVKMAEHIEVHVRSYLAGKFGTKLLEFDAFVNQTTTEELLKLWEAIIKKEGVK